MQQTCLVDDSWHDAATATLTDRKSWSKLTLLLVETAKVHRKLETKEMSVTELELKTLLLREEHRTVPRTIRTELALSSNLEKEKSIETREAPGQDQGKCRDGESAQETQSKHFNWKSIAKDENPESDLTKYFRDLFSISEDQEELTQSERRHWVELWKT